MVDTFTETETTGFLSNMGKSIMAVPIGILLFFASFFVFWKTEGRINWSKVAETSTVVAADNATGNDGALVAVTGELSSTETVGDPDFLPAGPYIELDRNTQMYAWVEDVDTKKEKKTGGKTKTTKTYSYDMEWTRSPKSGEDFRHPEGHRNPPMPVEDASFAVTSALVGAWGFNPNEASLPSGEPLSLSNVQLTGKGATAKKVGDEVYMGKGTPDVPQLGDVKVSWSALRGGQTVTLFGEAAGGKVVAHMVDGEDRFFRAIKGTRAEAIATLATEYSAMGWMGRIAGFLMMWIGMTMVFAPLHGVMDILPFMGRVSRGLVGCITFPIALVLSAIAIVISMILHSIVAMIVIVLLLAGTGFVVWKKKQAAA